MSLRLVTAEMRLSSAIAKTTLCILGPSGGGKTSLARGLPARDTLVLDFEAGLMSVQDWGGDSIPIRDFKDACCISLSSLLLRGGQFAVLILPFGYNSWQVRSPETDGCDDCVFGRLSFGD